MSSQPHAFDQGHHPHPAEDEGDAARGSPCSPPTTPPSRACSTRPASTSCWSATRSGMVVAGPRQHAAGHAGRDDLPLPRRRPRRRARAGGRRHAVHVATRSSRRGGRAQRRPPGEGGRRRGGQARGRRRVRRAGAPARRARHPGDGPHRPDAAVGARAWAASRCRAATTTRRQQLLDDARGARGGRLLRARARGHPARAGAADHRGGRHPHHRHRRRRRTATARCWSSTTCSA